MQEFLTFLDYIKSFKYIHALHILKLFMTINVTNFIRMGCIPAVIKAANINQAGSHPVCTKATNIT
jgi:hypothetical protein